MQIAHILFPQKLQSSVKPHFLLLEAHWIPTWTTFQALSQKEIDYWELNEDYPRFPDIRDIDMTSMDPCDLIVCISTILVLEAFSKGHL